MYKRDITKIRSIKHLYPSMKFLERGYYNRKNYRLNDLSPFGVSLKRMSHWYHKKEYTKYLSQTEMDKSIDNYKQKLSNDKNTIQNAVQCFIKEDQTDWIDLHEARGIDNLFDEDSCLETETENETIDEENEDREYIRNLYENHSMHFTQKQIDEFDQKMNIYKFNDDNHELNDEKDVELNNNIITPKETSNYSDQLNEEEKSNYNDQLNEEQDFEIDIGNNQFDDDNNENDIILFNINNVTQGGDVCLSDAVDDATSESCNNNDNESKDDNDNHEKDDEIDD